MCTRKPQDTRSVLHCSARVFPLACEEWAHLQLLDDGPRIFFNDIHEYFLYMLCVPYIPEDAKTVTVSA